jgi:ribosomal protein S18 acetylase RimI-like enzyme
MNVRLAGPQDTQAVVSLWEQLMEHHRAADPRFEAVEKAGEVYADYLRGLFEKDEYAILIAENGEEPVGYAILAVLENPAVFRLPSYGFVSEMCVCSSRRGQGIGQKLWERSVLWFRERGVPVIQLNVANTNESGRKFWRKLGCREYLQVLWYDIPRPESETSE